MKYRQHEQHIHQFQKQYVYNRTETQLQMTEQPMQPQNGNIFNIAQSIMMDTYNQNQSNYYKPNDINEIKGNDQRYRYGGGQGSRERAKLGKVRGLANVVTKSIFRFYFKLYLVEVVGAYIVTFSFLLLNKVIQYPLFQNLLILTISLTLTPFQIPNLFILLSIPMSIANYNIGVWVLTYPEIIICFVSTYIFRQIRFRSLLWIVEAVLFAVFGFFVLHGIHGIGAGGTGRVVLYYVFPWLLLLFRGLGSLINQVIVEPNLFLLQIPFFLSGICYGMLLSLQISNVQFWYILLLLTLDIINTRYQFLMTILKKLLSLQHHISVVESQSSGYNAIHSFHLIIFVYLISYTNLNSARFDYNFSNCVDIWYKPLVVWGFLSTYEAIAILKVNKYQNLMIIGFRDNQWEVVALRGFSLALGLWFFYLGLGTTSQIFFT